MGYASYFEDIRDRIADGLDRISRDIDQYIRDSHHGTARRNFRKQVETLETIRERCKELLKELDSLLDLATDPKVDLAGRLRLADKRISKLESEQDQLIEKIGELSQKLKNERKRRISAERELRRLNDKIAADPEIFASAIEAYSHNPPKAKDRPTSEK